MGPFRLVIKSPLPEGKRLAWIDLNPYVTALSWTTGVGGFGQLNVGYMIRGQPMSLAGLPRPIEIPDLATIQVFYGSEDGFLCFEGRAYKVNDKAGLHVSKVLAGGFGTSNGALNDDYFSIPQPIHPSTQTKSIDDVERSAVQLLRRIIPATTDIIRLGSGDDVIDPGGSYTPRQQSGRYPGQAIDQIIKAGADGDDVMFAIYENQRMKIKPVEPPLDDDGHFAPDYSLSAEAKVDSERDSSRMIGAAACEFTPPGKAKQATPIHAIDGWSELHGGLFRSMLIPTSAVSEPQAISVRDRWLRRHHVPLITGTVTVGDMSTWVTNRFGQPVPFYMYRYGQWILWDDQPYFITDTHIDASSKPARTTVTFVNVPLFTGEVG